MKKIIIGTLIVGALGASFWGGWLASDMKSKSVSEAAVKQSNNLPTQSSSERFVDVSSGTGMDPAEMYTELQKRNGSEFDSQYMAYIILMQSNMSGMNKLAKDRATAPELISNAEQMWQQGQETSANLSSLQSRLGYSHH